MLNNPKPRWAQTMRKTGTPCLSCLACPFFWPCCLLFILRLPRGGRSLKHPPPLTHSSTTPVSPAFSANRGGHHDLQCAYAAIKIAITAREHHVWRARWALRSDLWGAGKGARGPHERQGMQESWRCMLPASPAPSPPAPAALTVCSAHACSEALLARACPRLGPGG